MPGKLEGDFDYIVVGAGTAGCIVANRLSGDPGKRVLIEGVAEDGTIEAIRIAEAPSFALGVQWHAEYDTQHNPINRKLFEAFGEALAERQRAAA